jgi:hypothetical protein
MVFLLTLDRKIEDFGFEFGIEVSEVSTGRTSRIEGDLSLEAAFNLPPGLPVIA